MKVEVKISYSRDVEPIAIGTPGEWIDLRSAIDAKVKRGSIVKVPCGFSAQLPEGYEAIIALRSSSAIKKGLMLANGIGVIDNAYSGTDDEWCFLVYATRDCSISKNERIAQFRLQQCQPEVDLVVTENSDNSNRGGFGSTGSF